MRGRLAVGLGILALAAALRLPRLAERPMHADEAALADRFSGLLEGRGWRYDPANFHGPLLPYATFPVAWARGARTYAGLDEPALRLTAAIFGLALVGACLLAGGCRAGLLAAISPAMVYYSRYYIPEMALVCWTAWAAALGRRFLAGGGVIWGLGAGAALGAMWLTKETAVLAYAAMGAALLSLGIQKPPPRWWVAPLAAAAAAALQPRMLVALPGYVERAFTDSRHAHAWHYYLALLASEPLIAALGLAGGVSAVRRPGWPRLLAVFTLALAAGYSLIPYKTPWCALSILCGLILLAAEAPVPRRRPLTILVLIGCAHLAWQSWRLNFPLASDPRNPWAYAHTNQDVFLIRDRLRELGGGPLQVYSRQNLWPLPWYFRSTDQVEWWDGVREDAPLAPLILATPEMEAALLRRIYEVPPPGERRLYVPMFDRPVHLRPGVEVRGYAALVR